MRTSAQKERDNPKRTVETAVPRGQEARQRSLLAPNLIRKTAPIGNEESLTSSANQNDSDVDSCYEAISLNSGNIQPAVRSVGPATPFPDSPCLSVPHEVWVDRYGLTESDVIGSVRRSKSRIGALL